MNDGKVKGYKGFDKDFKCRGFQYEVGKTYTHDGTLKICYSGFHFGENPLDVFSYYDPGSSKYTEVEAGGVSDQTESDSKRVSKTLHIGAELSLTALCGLGVKFILDKVDFANAPATNTGYSSAATNTGYSSAATNTGDRSAATNTGYRSAATNTGEEGCAISLGIEGKASGALGCWLTLAEWKQNEKYEWHRIDVQTKKVDGKKIKAETFYALKDGKFTEAVRCV